MPKSFASRASEFRTLAPGFGGCLASDKITVDGERVGWMYREAPDYGGDSGWRFLSGTETQEYADDAANWEIYDVNTIANYDPDIVPLLNAPLGAEFTRDPLSGPLRMVPESRDTPRH
jgi:hypothetical protein